VYRDDITGSTFNRPDWLELENTVQEGDTIVFKEISRYSREAEKGYEKYMELLNKGVNLIFLDNPTVSTDYIKNLMNIANSQDNIPRTVLKHTIELLLKVELDRVEKEREIIVKRIKQGIEASEKVGGRRRGSLAKLSDDLRNDIKKLLQDRTVKYSEVMKAHNISRNTLKKYIEIVKASES
jgi:DNA invertase Pin-like site-specific DNA recombinase